MLKRTKYFFLLLVLFLSSILYSRDFKGAEYRTKVAYLYGRFEVNYKSSNREGILSTFFTYFDGSASDPWDLSKWNEIDLEILGRYNDNIQFNAITPSQQNHVRSHYINFDPSEDYHAYGFEWTPEYVAWFVDGVEVYRQTDAHIQTLNHAQKIMMNIWNPVYDNWVGDWNPEILPAFAYYDWVSYYSYTPGSGNYGNGNNFTHEWTDNFDSWDQARWGKATHTFNGNNCDFIPENIVFKNGKMILCLTDNTNIGLTDNTKPTLQWARAIGSKINVMFSEEVDQMTAETSSNFFINGVTINSAVQQKDKRIVDLDVTGLNQEQSYNLISLNIKDTAGNIMSARAVQLINNASLNFPVKINVGGIAWNDYLADQKWDEKTEYGYMDGSNTQYNIQIANTEEDQIYNSERNGLVEYKVRVPEGSYNITLMFAENYFNQSGLRVFDAYVENESNVQSNIDIYQTAGTSTAYNIFFNNIIVDDGVLDIYLPAQKNNSLLNGIQVESNPTGINEGGLNIPQKFHLEQNYPNPFNPVTTLSFAISESSFVNLVIYDVLGNEVATLLNENLKAGTYDVEFNAAGLSSGVYLYKINSAQFTKTLKMILLN